MGERYEFDKEQAYKLTSITDCSGEDKSQSRDLYRGILGCVATNLRWDADPCFAENYRMRMEFVRNDRGQPIKRSLHTSVVECVEETLLGINIYTEKSIYEFERAEIKRPPFKKGVCRLIELYMSTTDDHHFGAGFYHSENRRIYHLSEHVHVGTFHDSVLIMNDRLGIVCRYFPGWEEALFYDTYSDNQGNKIPMLIHNTGTGNLEIKFQGYEKTWTIPAGESIHIIPYSPDDADPEEGAK